MILNDLEFMPVILGGDLTCYSLARSFYDEYGVKCIVISLSKNGFASYSRFIESIVEPEMEKTDVFVATLQKLGKKYAEKKLILLAGGDWYVRASVENKDKLPENVVVPYVELELLDRLVLKDSFYEICEDLEIPYPETFVYDLKENTPLELPFSYPVIAKPADSARYHYAEFEDKRKVYKFNTAQELSDMLARLRQSSYGYKFLIQDFIPGDDTYMRILTCYCDKNSDVKFAAFGRVLLEDHGPGAIGNPIAIISDVDDQIVAQAAKLLKHVGYTGFANFDLKYDTRDGSVRFFEVNPRLGRSNYYITGSGFPVSRWLVDDLIYNKELPYTVADRKSLFTVVPKSVVLDYVKDPSIREEIKELYKTRHVARPLIFKKDKGLIHRLYHYLFVYRQMRKYYTYK